MLKYLLEHQGQSRTQAEEEALKILNLSEKEIKFEQVGSNSLKRLFKSSPAVVRGVPTHDDVDQESVIRGVIYTLLRKMGVSAEIQTIRIEDENFYVEIESESSSLLIGRHGRTLDSIQFLANLLASRWDSRIPRIILDFSGYRQRRRESIKELCLKASDKAASSGRPVVLNYMSPYERRIVHVLLDEDDRVITESMGNKVYKRLRVIPKDYTERRGNRGRRGDFPEDQEYGSEENYSEDQDYGNENYRDEDDYPEDQEYGNERDASSGQDYEDETDYPEDKEYKGEADDPENEEYRQEKRDDPRDDNRPNDRSNNRPNNRPNDRGRSNRGYHRDRRRDRTN